MDESRPLPADENHEKSNSLLRSMVILFPCTDRNTDGTPTGNLALITTGKPGHSQGLVIGTIDKSDKAV